MEIFSLALGRVARDGYNSGGRIRSLLSCLLLQIVRVSSVERLSQFGLE